MGIHVKQLCWEETVGRYPSHAAGPDGGDGDATEVVYWATDLLWSFAVEYDPFTGGAPWMWLAGGKVMGHFDTVDAAKEAAQAEYGRRILAAIEFEAEDSTR